jgi:proteasome lid subunit RPN8/RPN11
VSLCIARDAVEKIRAHARAAYPEECCGFLIGKHAGEDRVVTEARRADNVHPGPRGTRYTIDNEATRRVEAEFRVGEARLVGFYHSHPDHPATPSEFDLRSAWEYYVYAIMPVPADEPGDLRAWSLDGERRTFNEVPVNIE